MSCGTFCLAEANFDIQNTIPKDKLVTYKNFDECFLQILHYLNHETKREKLAKNSYDWYLNTYNSKAFWQEFLYKVTIGDNNFYNTPFVENNYQTIKQTLLSHYKGQVITPEHITNFSINYT